MGLHWHGDVFNLPSRSTALASSELTRYQVYRYGRNAYGFLFHLEVTPPMLRVWTKKFAGELRRESLSGPGILWDAKKYQPFLQALGGVIFDRWAEMI